MCLLWAFFVVHTGVSRWPPTLSFLCLWRTKHKSLHWAFNRHLQMVGQLAILSHTGVNRRYLGPELQQRQGLILDYIGPEVDSIPRSSWSLPDLKKLWLFIYTMDIVIEMASDRVAILTEFTGGAPALRRGIYQDVGEPMYLTFSTAGMYAGKSLITMGNVGHLSTCGIFLCRREEELSAPRVRFVLKA